MFSNGSYATIWDVKETEKYVDARISTSKKDNDGKYIQDFSAIVRFVGEAKDIVKGKKPKDRIKILNCGVTNKYDKDKKALYTNYVVFSCEDASWGKPADTKKPEKEKEAEPELDMNAELPF